jgi:hypothetical protein
LQAYLQPKVEGRNHFHILAAVRIRKKTIDGCWVGPMPLWMYGEEGDLCPCHSQKLNTNIPVIRPLTLSLYQLHYTDSSSSSSSSDDDDDDDDDTV